jgi:hypothetical protein
MKRNAALDAVLAELALHGITRKSRTAGSI